MDLEACHTPHGNKAKIKIRAEGRGADHRARENPLRSPEKCHGGSFPLSVWRPLQRQPLQGSLQPSRHTLLSLSVQFPVFTDIFYL